MKEYESYEDACRDAELDLKVIWKCWQCGHVYEDYPDYNEALECECGGQHVRAGESYRG